MIIDSVVARADGRREVAARDACDIPALALKRLKHWGIVMKLFAVALSVFATALLAPSAAAQDVVAGRRIIREADPAIWSGKAESGPVTHLMSSTVFPGAIEGFERFRLMAVENGSDVALNYRKLVEPTKTYLTVFLFKPGNLPEHKLKPSIEALGLREPGAPTFLWADGPFTIDAAAKLRIFKATYKTGIGPDTVMDYLYFAPLGSWTVKVRATLGSTKDIADEEAIDAAVRALPWNAILSANGVCGGAACDAARPMAINSHIMEGTITGLMEAAPIVSPTALHSMTASGAAWRVSALDARIADVFSKSYGGVSATMPLYSLIRTEGGKDQIVRFYSGEPSRAMFEAEVAGLVTSPETSNFISPAQAAAYQPE